MRTAAILPIKSFARAKQRLGVTISDQLRVDLVSAMVADVLLALAETASIERTIVVTGEAFVAAGARKQGALVVNDAAEDGQSSAVTLGVERALLGGIERVLCIPGDCPALDPAELESLLGASSEAPEVVIVPDRHGTGTNGLLLTPPDVIVPSFGTGSCERHQGLARAAGVAFRLERPSSLLLDIDTGDDLAALRERLGGERTRAARTRTVLGASERTDVLPISKTG